jgi:hypothetical protein
VTQLGATELTRLADELFTDDARPMKEDVEAWGIEPEALELVFALIYNSTIRDLSKGENPRLALGIAFYAAFGLGYKCALELEMHRITEET